MENQGAKDRQEDLENKDKYQTYYEDMVIWTAQDWHRDKSFWIMEQKDSKNSSQTPSPAQNGQQGQPCSMVGQRSHLKNLHWKL